MPSDEDPTGLGRGRDVRDEIERSVLPEDRLLELAQRTAGLECEILTEPSASVLVRGERLGLAPRPVESEHQLSAQPLAERMLCGKPFQLPDQIGVTAELQIGFDPGFERRQAQLLQATDLGPGKRRVPEVSKRRAPPERQCLPQFRRRRGRVRRSRLGDETLKALKVELTLADDERIPRRAGLDHVVPEQFPEL